MKKIILFLLITINISYASDSTKTDYDKTISSLESHLRHSQINDRKRYYLVNFWNYTVGIPTGINFDDTTDRNIWTKKITPYVKTLIEFSEDEIKNLRGSSKGQLAKKLQLKSKILQLAYDPRMKPEHTALLVVAADKFMNQIITELSDDTYAVNMEILKEIKNVRGGIEKLSEELDDLEVDSPKLEKFIKENVKKLIENNNLIALQNNELIRNLTVEIQTLINESDGSEETKRKIRELKEKLSKEVAKEHENFNYQEYKKWIDEIGYGLTIATSLYSLVDPEKAYQYQEFVSNALIIADNVGLIIAQTGTAAASLGPYAAIAVAAVNLISMFKNKNAQSAEQIILEQLQKLSEQVEDFRMQMHQRFDIIEQYLGDIYIGLLDQFVAIHKRLDNIDHGLNELRSISRSIERKINNLDRAIYQYELERTTRPYALDRDKYINWRNIYVDPMGVGNFRDASHLFYDWVTDISSRSIIAGQKVTPWSLDQSGIDLIDSSVSKRNFDSLIQTFASYVGYNELLPNPYAWSDGVDGYRRIVRNNPNHKPIFKLGAYENMKKRGESINDFSGYLQDLRVQTELLKNLNNAHQELNSELIEGRNLIVTKNYNDTRTHLIRDVSKKLSGAKIIDSPGTKKNKDRLKKSLDLWAEGYRDRFPFMSVVNGLNRDTSKISLGRYCAVPITKTKNYTNMAVSGRRWHPNWKLNDPLILTNLQCEKIVPANFLLLETLGEGRVSFNYDIDAPWEPIPQNTGGIVTVTPHLSIGAFIRINVKKITLNVYFTPKEKKPIKIGERIFEPTKTLESEYESDNPIFGNDVFRGVGPIRAIAFLKALHLKFHGGASGHRPDRRKTYIRIFEENSRITHALANVVDKYEIAEDKKKELLALQEEALDKHTRSLAQQMKIKNSEQDLLDDYAEISSYKNLVHILCYYALNQTYNSDIAFRDKLEQNIIMHGSENLKELIDGQLDSISFIKELDERDGVIYNEGKLIEALIGKALLKKEQIGIINIGLARLKQAFEQ